MNELNKGGNVAVALGNFDGMHIGHVAVMNETWKYLRKGFAPCVVLFDEHSLKGVTGEAPPMLMSIDSRNSFITDSGFAVRTLDFEKIKNFSPEEFVKKILVDSIGAGVVVCGYNYHFGKSATGNADTMRELCKQYGIECKIVGEVDCGDKPVSSTRIRNAIENGEIEKANTMLGREFSFSAEVINGEKRGRTWGFPTINQLLPENLVMPKFGVYESEVVIDTKVYKGVTNIGKRPTIGTDVILSETNIIDFDEDIYGKTVEIKLIRFLRTESKFNSFEELANQIKNDVQNVKRGE